MYRMRCKVWNTYAEMHIIRWKELNEQNNKPSMHSALLLTSSGQIEVTKRAIWSNNIQSIIGNLSNILTSICPLPGTVYEVYKMKCMIAQ